ncbi:MAG: mannitol-phosphate 5-dehydrogenase [Solirubrobacteraceae bacterium]|nr:mannitol-phosphate 5-dehydrogenase [Solirubrobacteraceae bacterium]
MRCLVLGAGRIAGGLVVPLLRDAGWDVTLVSRTPAVVDAVEATGCVSLSLTSAQDAAPRRVDGVRAILEQDGAALARAVSRCDLIVTAVGASELAPVGRRIAALLDERIAAGRSLNVIAFENHPHAAQALAGSIVATRPGLAPHVGRTLGVAGAAVWRCIARREVRPDGVAFAGDAHGECHVDRSGLVEGPPLDGSVPGLSLTSSFRARMTEKLWLSNAPHAATAYLGWQRGHETIDAALADPEIAGGAGAVVAEVQEAFARWQAARPWADAVPPRSPASLLARHADPRLADPVARVARAPRRKLGPADRLIAPALALLAGGEDPRALAGVCAAALRYREPTDPQALDIGAELSLLGPAETLASIAGLDPSDRLVGLVTERYDRATRADGRLLAAAVAS